MPFTTNAQLKIADPTSSKRPPPPNLAAATAQVDAKAKKADERPMVMLADAAPEHAAVMVESCHALTARAAVVGAWWAELVANAARRQVGAAIREELDKARLEQHCCEEACHD